MSLLVGPCASTGDGPSRTHYEVLDICPDEQDPKVIEEAALRCSDQVQVYQLTRELECTLLLNDIARAFNTLLDPVLRREYDLGLGKPLGPALEGMGSETARREGEAPAEPQPETRPEPRPSDSDPFLRGRVLGPALSERRPPGRRDTPVLLPGKSAAPAPGKDTRLPLIRDGGTCDVKLVRRRWAG